MGAWGTAIFSDDIAADTRDAFTDFIIEGLKSPDATERLLAESTEILADDEEAIVFWLALAATQWKLGRLLPDVRDRAIKIIDSGVDLHRFEGNPRSEINQRKKHLSKLHD
jgi:AcrR family transcriptional regulator